MNPSDIISTMPFGGWLTLIVLAVMTLIIARDRLGPDLAMFSALGVLLVAGVLSPERALQGFSNKALVTIAALFVVAATIKETGALTLISSAVFGRTQTPWAGLVRIIFPTAGLSAFVNNTPVVVMMIPAVRDFAKRIEDRPSRFLIPLAYAAMLGGTCTLIGTSANLVVSGLLEQNNLPKLGMLDISWVGIPTLAVGLLYLLTAGYRLLDIRRTPRESLSDEPREYLAEVRLAPDSPLVGRTVESAGLRNLPGLFLAELRRRDGRVIRPVNPQTGLQGGDHLVLSGIASTVQDLQSFPGLHPVDEPTSEIEVERGLFEVVISHRSNLVGRSVRDVGFRRRYDAAILAVHRSGEPLQQRIGDISLRAGDTLMLSASPGFHDTYRNHAGFYLISSVPNSAPARYRNAHVSLVALLLLVLLPTITGVDMLTAAIGTVVFFLATRCISPRGVRQSIDWSVLLVIGSALGLANALQDSGGADLLATLLVVTLQGLGPIAILAGVYLVALVCASLLTNAAAAALVFPIALETARAASLDPRALSIAVALGASAAFATPLGSNALLLISGPGGYRYRDFLKVGLPLNLLCLLVTILILPLVWPLSPAP